MFFDILQFAIDLGNHEGGDTGGGTPLSMTSDPYSSWKT